MRTSFPHFTFLTLAVFMATAHSLHAADKVWQGDESTLWSTAGNWDTNSIATSADIAYFGPSATSTTVSTNGSSRQTAQVIFQTGAAAFTISGTAVLAPTIITVEAGVTTDQSITAITRSFGTLTVNHQGTGALILSNFNDAGAGTAASTMNFSGSGNLTISDVSTSTRAMRINHSGTGLLTIDDVYDFNLTDSGTNSLITVNAGSFNLSSMVLNLRYAAAPTLASYTLVSYAGAAGVTTSGVEGVYFESVTVNGVAGLPSGYTIVNDTVGQAIRLVAVPEPGSGMAFLAGMFALLVSCRRSR